MKPTKKELVQGISRQELRNVLDALEITNVDRRSPERMREAIVRSRGVDHDRLKCLLAGITGRTTHTLVTKPRDVFVAIDFETADQGRDSACAVGIVRVEDGEIVARQSALIRPPRRHFQFTYLHGISWEDVSNKPAFDEVWRSIEPHLDGASALYAHNAPFDRSVVEACCGSYGLPPPSTPWRCSLALARARWGMRRNALPDVCEFLGIALNHHDATSDAEACARIVLAAREPAFVASPAVGFTRLR